MTNITFNLTEFTIQNPQFANQSIYNEYDLIANYCSSLDTQINMIIFIIVIFYFLMELLWLINRFPKFEKIDSFLEDSRKGFYNILIIPFGFLFIRILIYENLISEKTTQIISIVLTLLAVIGIFLIYIWKHREINKYIMKYIK